MAKFNDSMTDEHISFINKQKIFFNATAPLSKDGHINLSPKGLDSFRVLSPARVTYMDIIGSGNETSAHILENNRITFMFCSFDGPPNILRLYGKAYTVLPGNSEWNELAALFNLHPSLRQFIVADIDKVQTSCGFSVPLYDYAGERDHSYKWAKTKGQEGLQQYIKDKNSISIDGLPSAIAENI
ncbi:MAG: pyridoxamine 5'-phosphate oxidase family protein [Panacibacter sp.]